MKPLHKSVFVIFAIVILLNAYLGLRIFESEAKIDSPALYFLDVGQGDSQLIEVPVAGGKIQVLVDGGPNASVLHELGRILPAEDRYIDLVVMTHPQTDHFSGLLDVFKKYDVGAFLTSGRKGETVSYAGFHNLLEKSGTPIVVMKEGDLITFGETKVQVVSPSSMERESAEVNDASLVMRFQFLGWSALYTGDMGEGTERRLTAKYDLKSDVLKVPHHGSRFSSSEQFLAEVDPKIAVIEVGKNSYGHPTPATMGRLKEVGSLIFTTLKSGTIKITENNDELQVVNIGS